MITEVRVVFVPIDGGTIKEVPIRSESNHLMKNRLNALLREYPNIIADDKLGVELLAQAQELHAKCVEMQEINRTTERELRHVRRKIFQNEVFYLALFGQLPASYLDGTPVQ